MTPRRPDRRGPKPQRRQDSGQRGRSQGKPKQSQGKPKQAARPAKPRKVPAESIVVNGYSERWVRRGFPWVYPKEVLAGELVPGQITTVLNEKGEFLARGIADDGWLAIRIFTHEDVPLSAELIVKRLEAAKAWRDQIIPPETSGYRLVHSENDLMPGVRVDWWADWPVIALDSPSLGRLVAPIAEWLRSEMGAWGVYLAYRPDPREERESSSFDPAPGLVAGEPPQDEVDCMERGVRMWVRPQEGPDVGMYVDMRDVRRWLDPHWMGTRVLNTFAYTGAFGLHAALAGAEHVSTVDLSPHYIDRAKRNFEANGLLPSDYEFVVEDTFKALDRYRRKGELFDRIILDPPSFSHSKAGRWSAVKDYPRLVAAAARVCAPGGWIVAATNRGQTSRADFRNAVEEGLRKAGRLGSEVQFFGAAPDFPAHMQFPEGRYLKVGVWRVV